MSIPSRIVCAILLSGIAGPAAMAEVNA